jgi:uroporphyrinogen decarboxylase
MTSKERMVTAIENKIPDRLPVTTHHIMESFLKDKLDGMSTQEFFDEFGFDPIHWTVPHKADKEKGFFVDPERTEPGFLQSRWIFSDSWSIDSQPVTDSQYNSERFTIHTPKGELTMVLQSNPHTAWVWEHPIKEKRDIDLLAAYMTYPLCDVDQVNKEAEEFGQRGLIRGHIVGFDVYGQPGCWQDACCLVGTEQMIMYAYDDPEWVHEFLTILLQRKKKFVQSLKGAKYDILELGGGDASTTVISPKIFNEFVAPYDSQVIALAHDVGQRIVYHTCGGMMPILEDIASMQPDAMETFTPPEMGADVNLAEAKKRIGTKVAMIGGFDQVHFFTDRSPEETRTAVRRCFEEAGDNGGYILAPSDHFFEAKIDLLHAFVDEAKSCTYQ